MKKMLCVMMALLMLCGCNTVIGNEDTSSTTAVADNTNYTEGGADASYEISGSTYISLGNEDVKINKAGTYILEGTLNGSVIVEVSDSEDVQLVLNNVTINSADFAGIYIVEGDEITITLAEDSVNTISDSSAYTQIDSNEVDALIYSKADLFINGEGSLVLDSAYNHGIVSKDDLVVTSGNFTIDVAGAGMKGKDCLIISD
ncbi:MAG: carbohydrate-binding domain-containing protein, partial [Erysipelotrichaceae bacterium]|nr:carbohydrate-binding domain-containing protein [Erysipelotrichaceae bacterium]